MRRVVVYADAQAVADATGARLGLLISDAVSTRGIAHVVLTGGTVGIELLRSLASSPLATLIDWMSVHVWWGDERFVPAGDPDRNEFQAQHALLSSVPLPEENIHRMGSSDDFTSAEAAAAAYSDEIAAHGTPTWDVAMFGMGPDGHIASLFPDHPVYLAGGDAEAVAVHDSPKPPPTRISLTLASINRSREVWVVAAGEAKADAVAGALRSDSTLPASRVHGVAATMWLVDAAAATKV